MTNSEQAIREFADGIMKSHETWGKPWNAEMREEGIEEIMEITTALISEHYVSKEDVNQEVERRIAETVAGKFIAVEIEKRIADRQLTDEQIERQFTTSHYHYEKGHYYKVRKDRIFGAKWYRDRLVSQKTDNLKENNNNGSTN